MNRKLVSLLALCLLGLGFVLDPAYADGSHRLGTGPDFCHSDSDCDDGLFCNGREYCDLDSPAADIRGCAPHPRPCGSGQRCSERDDLCTNICRDASGREVTPDSDGDGHDAIICGGDDCDDRDANRYPGNFELCNGHDEDCDPTTVGNKDSDGDGHIDSACFNLGPK